MKFRLWMFASLSLALLFTESVKAFQVNLADKPKTETLERTLDFPADRSMGTLTIAIKPQDNKPEFWFGGAAFKELGLAQGKITIPAGYVVQLKVSAAACEDLSPLADLPPGGIDSVYFRNGRIKGFEHLGKLTELKALVFRGCALKDADVANLSNSKISNFCFVQLTDIKTKGLD